MKKFYSGIVKHRKLIIVIFAVLFIVCMILQNIVEVNYDVNDYLPEDCKSTISIDVMEEEFDGGIPNARVMVYDVTVPQALEYKKKIEQVSGVTNVTWLDDAADITVPLSSIDTDTVETYYKDNNALFTVTIEEHSRISATQDIREIIGDDNALTGSAVSTAVATTNTVSEIRIITIIAVIFVLIVLIITTNSWFEPIVVLLGLGVAIILNNGSNAIFGEISFVTNAAGSVLQLAVSLDYSVFLIHRFEECRKINDNPESAMVDALCKSTTSILSSGLTTVIGFLALILMRFGIGADLGLALAKGVAISLITVFIFMPALILSTYKLLDKTRHKAFLPSFRGFGKFIQKITIPAVCIFALIIAPAYLASNSNDYYYGSSHIYAEGTTYGNDTNKIEDVFGKSDTYVLLVPKGDLVKQSELSDELHRFDEISSIISYVDTVGVEIPEEYLDPDTLSQLVSDNYSRMVLSVDVDYEGEKTFDLVENIRAVANKYYPDSYYLAGEGVSTYDLMETVTADMIKVNLIAIAAVFIVLLLTMRSISLPIILVLSIETAIWLNLSVPYFSNSTIFYIAYLIISSIQLGATVDYAILMTERYKEHRQTQQKKDAVIQTVSSVTVSILTSGSVLTAVGLLIGYISSNQLLAQLGIFVGRGAVCSLMIVFFVLPGLLYLFDRLIIKKNKKALTTSDGGNPNEK
ncbi:efflux RND transporter permease subunit [Ruminococcus sp.]|uniref:efflux RND transporter permease subunit n=1 Tax=Ruminococcus sp. TaxID=41978 RepID=UPI003F0F2855